VAGFVGRRRKALAEGWRGGRIEGSKGWVLLMEREEKESRRICFWSHVVELLTNQRQTTDNFFGSYLITGVAQRQNVVPWWRGRGQAASRRWWQQCPWWDLYHLHIAQACSRIREPGP